MLFRSVFRHFTRKAIQVFLLGLIIIFSAFIYVVMDYSITAIKNPTEDYFTTYNQEDFNVTILGQLLPEEYGLFDESYQGSIVTMEGLYRQSFADFEVLINERILAFEAAYEHTKIEARLFKDVFVTTSDLQHTIRFLKDAKEINLSYITKGNKPNNANEIALTEVYAKAHNIKIGDTINWNQQSYDVVGYVLFPDYSLSVFGNEFILNNNTRTLALLHDDGFHALQESIQTQFSGVFTLDNPDKNSLKNIRLDYILHIGLTENTMRSGAIYEELAGGEAMGMILSLIIASMAVFVVSIMVSRMLSEQRGAIGILKALGYRNKEIILPYLFFILLIALPGLLIGYLLGWIVAEPLKQFYIGIYLLPDIPIGFSINTLMISIILPMVILLGLGYFVVNKILQDHPIALMNPKTQKPNTKNIGLNRFIHKMPLLRRLKHAYMWRNPIRFSVFLIGVFTAVYLILLALSMLNFSDKMMKDYYDTNEVNYIGYCDSVQGCGPEATPVDQVLDLPYVMLENKSITLIGLDPVNQFHPLFENGKEITNLLSEEGIIITKGLSMELKLKKNDLVTLSYGGNTLSVRILGIQDEYNSGKVYVNRTALSLFVSRGTSTNLFTSVYSNTPLTGNYSTIIVIEDLIKQGEDLAQMAVIMVYVMVAASIVIGAIVMILISVLALEAYFYDISLFKVIGYNNKEIERIFINSYQWYTIVLYVVTIPIAFATFELTMWYLATQFSMIFPMSLTIVQLIIGLILTLLMFYIAVPVAKRKLSQHTLQQALKIYQDG